MMNLNKIAAGISLALAIGIGVDRLSAQSGYDLFQKALATERADGNLQQAIQLYERVVREFASDRAVAANALVRMAECYQKLGDAESRKTYERVLSEYPEQKEAVAIARARLGGNTTARKAGIVTRQVWANANAVRLGSVSPDGRYVSFHRNTGDLLLHDLSNGEDRRLSDSRNADDYPGGSAFARDGKQVAYAWGEGSRHQLRAIGVNGAAPTTPRVLYDNEDTRNVWPSDWSPDGKWIAVQLLRTDRTMQIALVSPIDRSLRVLKSMDWRGSDRMVFSPDGRYLAFDLPSDQDSEHRDVFVLAIDGSREISAVVHPANDLLMGWTADGKHLLFNSDRSGSLSLWALAFQNGKASGVPEMIKPDIGLVHAIGTTRSGELYFALRARGPDLYTASIDFDSGDVVTRPVPAVQEFVGSNREGSWSRDGKYLAYKSVHRDQVLAIRSVETGKTRYVRPDLTYWYTGGWSADGRFTLTQGTDRKGRQGIFRIDLQTGAAEAFALNPPHISFKPQWASDDKRIFYGYASSGHPTVLVERDIASRQERELLRRERLSWWSTSPDGQHLVWSARDPSTGESTLSIRPVAGGEPRELLRLKDPERFRTFMAWTPDSRRLLYQRISSPTAQESELWLVPASGGKPRKIDLGFADLRELKIHPDGRQVVFHTPTDTYEVWVMENFLPALTASK